MKKDSSFNPDRMSEARELLDVIETVHRAVVVIDTDRSIMVFRPKINEIPLPLFRKLEFLKFEVERLLLERALSYLEENGV